MMYAFPGFLPTDQENNSQSNNNCESLSNILSLFFFFFFFFFLFSSFYCGLYPPGPLFAPHQTCTPRPSLNKVSSTQKLELPSSASSSSSSSSSLLTSNQNQKNPFPVSFYLGGSLIVIGRRVFLWCH